MKNDEQFWVEVLAICMIVLIACCAFFLLGGCTPQPSSVSTVPQQPVCLFLCENNVTGSIVNEQDFPKKYIPEETENDQSKN